MVCELREHDRLGVDAGHEVIAAECSERVEWYDDAIVGERTADDRHDGATDDGHLLFPSGSTQFDDVPDVEIEPVEQRRSAEHLVGSGRGTTFEHDRFDGALERFDPDRGHLVREGSVRGDVQFTGAGECCRLDAIIVGDQCSGRFESLSGLYLEVPRGAVARRCGQQSIEAGGEHECTDDHCDRRRRSGERRQHRRPSCPSAALEGEA